MSTIALRTFTSDDVDRYSRLLHALSRRDVRTRYFSWSAPASPAEIRAAMLGKDTVAGIAAHDSSGALIGVAQASRCSEGKFEIGVLVAESHRLRGIGGRLVDALLEKARIAGYSDAIAYSMMPNPAVEAVLRKRGFRASLTGQGIYRWCLRR